MRNLAFFESPSRHFAVRIIVIKNGVANLYAGHKFGAFGGVIDALGKIGKAPIIRRSASKGAVGRRNPAFVRAYLLDNAVFSHNLTVKEEGRPLGAVNGRHSVVKVKYKRQNLVFTLGQVGCKVNGFVIGDVAVALAGTAKHLATVYKQFVSGVGANPRDEGALGVIEALPEMKKSVCFWLGSVIGNPHFLCFSSVLFVMQTKGTICPLSNFR